ncbi:MAG: nitrate reductase subunit beta [Conexivisphaerales archaeon]
MNVKAQICMVMNLDKCIGCHTCSVTCKNTWTNRPGAEYIWFNDVETKPGLGYPRSWENQSKNRGGWELRNGKLRLKQGGKLSRLLKIFFNPVLPILDDYYDPWTYSYEQLTSAPQGSHQPVARPISSITGSEAQPAWGPNWEDDLAGSKVTAPHDINLKGLENSIRLEYEDAFMFYLPRICEHCLNPSCVASCPSGAIYKREEDGIVLVDQEACRGWRFCISGCPYKKVYFNWKTHKAEKCTFCYPRIESGLPTICSETCVGRIRYIGVMLYDADRVHQAASVRDEKELLSSQLSVFLDPFDEDVKREAIKNGIPEEWIDYAKRSPVYKLIVKWRLALPIHPEYRTLPMVWYIPPLSPIADRVLQTTKSEDDIFPSIDKLRIPILYLANLLTAGDEEPVRATLKKLAAVRIYMRAITIGAEPDWNKIGEAGLTEQETKEIFRLLSIAKFEERFVIPTSHRELARDLYTDQGLAGLPFYEKEEYARYLASQKGKGSRDASSSSGCSGCSGCTASRDSNTIADWRF